MIHPEAQKLTFLQQMKQMFMMAVISSLLLFSFVLTVFTPYPLGLASLLHGRLKGVITAVLGLGVSVIFVGVLGSVETLFLGIVFVICMSMALGLAEVVRKEMNPIKGISILTLIYTAITVILIWSAFGLKEQSFMEQIESQYKEVLPAYKDKIEELEKAGQDLPLEVKSTILQPELMAKRVVQVAPRYFFTSLITMLWFNLFLLLKSSRLLVKKEQSAYSEQFLLNYKMPDHAIWVVIAGLALYIWGESLGYIYPVLGESILGILGCFYFFQGLSIYMAFLDFLKLKGFIRSLLVIVTVFTAAYALAVVGLADMFVDFKKLMAKKSND